MPQVPVPVLHREGLFGPPPTQLDLVVDLAWCEVRTVAVICADPSMAVPAARRARPSVVRTSSEAPNKPHGYLGYDRSANAFGVH